MRYPNGKKVRNFHFPADLDDYRTAYRGYLTDPDLQDARARWPFVPVWDNHEFSWKGYQSQAANLQRSAAAGADAEGRGQPSLVRIPAGARHQARRGRCVRSAGRRRTRRSPNVDARGVGQEPNNLTAIRALRIERAFRFGKNIDMILTDNRSFMSAPIDGSNLPSLDFGFMPETANDILEAGREYPGGAPATLRIGETEIPNPQINEPPQAYLGIEQMAWFKERLRAAEAPWKIWGHSFGTLTWRTDPQNLPPEFAAMWPSTEYGDFNRSYVVEHAEIFGMVRDEGITGLTIVVGDKHSFWAGYPSETLPPRPFEPVGVEFVTGSISQAGLGGGASADLPARQSAAAVLRARPARWLEAMRAQHDAASRRARGACACATPTIRRRRAPRAIRTTRRTSPSRTSADMATPPCAPRRTNWKPSSCAFRRRWSAAKREDGGPLRYRVVHRVARWAPGERPQMRPEIVEGDVGLSI